MKEKNLRVAYKQTVFCNRVDYQININEISFTLSIENFFREVAILEALVLKFLGNITFLHEL